MSMRVTNQNDDGDSLGGLVQRAIGRRQFIHGAAMLAAAGVVMIGPQAWAARALEGDPSRKRLVVVFMRGAVDGLSLVAPYGDSQYYEQRPTIALARSGGGVIDI